MTAQISLESLQQIVNSLSLTRQEADALTCGPRSAVYSREQYDAAAAKADAVQGQLEATPGVDRAEWHAPERRGEAIIIPFEIEWSLEDGRYDWKTLEVAF